MTNNKPENFDDLIKKLEECLNELEQGNLSDEEALAKIQEAEKIKDKCKTLVENERDSILDVCKSNGIDPSEIGMRKERFEFPE